jgi:hypothetical protein
MKNLKTLLASLVVATVVFAAFTNFEKPTSLVLKYYNENDVTTTLISNLIPSELDDPGNWDGFTTSLNTSGAHLAAIDFNLDDVNPANGGYDGDLTLQEAISAVRYQYNTSARNFNSYSFEVGTATINIYPKSAP